MADALTPTQADRDAAIVHGERSGRIRTDLHGPAIRRGEWDHTEDVQAFARHRLDGFREGLEAAAKVVQNLPAMPLRVSQQENYGGEHREWSETYTLPVGCHIFSDIAAAILTIDPTTIGAALMTDEAIAAGLTEADRTFIRGKTRLVFRSSKQSDRLTNAGILTKGGINWTPLGLRIRAILGASHAAG